jgi:hypothetical protein
MRDDPNVLSFVELTVQLHSCVEKPEQLALELEELLRSELAIDYDSDIEVYISETT